MSNNIVFLTVRSRVKLTTFTPSSHDM